MTDDLSLRNALLAPWEGTISDRVLLWDQTLRDGEQTPGVAFSKEEKQRLARALDEFGIDCINAGFPAVSEEEADIVRSIVGLGLRAEMGATCRLRREDVDAAADVGVTWALAFASLSDWHLQYKMKTTEEAYLKQVEAVVPHARARGLRLAFAIEDATRVPKERLERFIRAAEACGAEAVRPCDTVGLLTPSSTVGFIRFLREIVRGQLIVHFHNDLGMATANTITALENGADTADVALAGLGERAGNTPLEEVVVVLRVKYGIGQRYKLDQLCELSRQAAHAAGIPVPANKPIVGKSVFSHESGVHVGGVLANETCYEPFPPALVGRKHEIVFGKHSGLASVRFALDKAGIQLDEPLQHELLRSIKNLGQSKQDVTWSWIVEEARRLAATRAPAGA